MTVALASFERWPDMRGPPRSRNLHLPSPRSAAKAPFATPSCRLVKWPNPDDQARNLAICGEPRTVSAQSRIRTLRATAPLQNQRRWSP
jgi:hypothetical protein